MNILKNTYILVVILVLKTTVGFSQQEITISDYLRVASHLDTVIVIEKTAPNFNLPLLNNIQLRTETRDFLLNRQEYSLRVKPNSIRAIGKQKSFFETEKTLLTLKKQLNFNEELKGNYTLVIDCVFNVKLTALYRVYKTQLKDKIHVLSKRVYSENFDVDDLVSAENDLLKVNLELLKLTKASAANKSLLKTHFERESNKDSLQFNLNDFISAQQIATTSFETVDETPLELQIQQLELDALALDYKLDKIENNQILDFVQVKYTGRENDVFEETVSFGLGINLPFPNRKKKGDYHYKKESEENKQVLLDQELKESNRDALNNFELARTHYDILADEFKNSSVSSLLAIYKKTPEVSPLLLLKLEMLLLKKEIEITRLEYDLYNTYIDVLSSKELLYKTPYINYLTAMLENIIPAVAE